MSSLLHAISHFSLMRGVLSPQQICRAARDLGYSSVAITDRNSLYALPAFLRSCKEYGLTPIIAAELTGPDGTALLYADGDMGFANLCRIISDYHCNDRFHLRDSIRMTVVAFILLPMIFSSLVSLKGAVRCISGCGVREGHRSK